MDECWKARVDYFSELYSLSLTHILNHIVYFINHLIKVEICITKLKFIKLNP